MSDVCRCHLSFEPPEGIKWWRPDLGDGDPGTHVRVVARYGEDPELRRAVRREDGKGWDERGWEVNYYLDLTPPLAWERVGFCWDDTPHPVVAAYQIADGRWVADASGE